MTDADFLCYTSDREINDLIKFFYEDNGISPDKLYTSVQVFGANEYYFKSMDKDRTYYFQIEAFNENGIGTRGPVIKSE